MLQLFLFFVVLFMVGVADIRSILKSDLKKELIPYSILMLAAGVVGLFYLSNPYRQSIAYWLLKLVNAGG